MVSLLPPPPSPTDLVYWGQGALTPELLWLNDQHEEGMNEYLNEIMNEFQGENSMWGSGSWTYNAETDHWVS